MIEGLRHKISEMEIVKFSKYNYRRLRIPELRFAGMITKAEKRHFSKFPQGQMCVIQMGQVSSNMTGIL